jgi:hypothetical protein
MPLYLLELVPSADAGHAQLEAAVSLATRRFPEVEVERRYVVRVDDPREVWVCRAPSEAHLTRWAAEAHLDVPSVSHVDAEMPPWSTSMRTTSPSTTRTDHTRPEGGP